MTAVRNCKLSSVAVSAGDKCYRQREETDDYNLQRSKSDKWRTIWNRRISETITPGFPLRREIPISGDQQKSRSELQGSKIELLGKKLSLRGGWLSYPRQNGSIPIVRSTVPIHVVSIWRTNSPKSELTKKTNSKEEINSRRKEEYPITVSDPRMNNPASIQLLSFFTGWDLTNTKT
jgi:hypothetical protein